MPKYAFKSLVDTYLIQVKFSQGFKRLVLYLEIIPRGKSNRYCIKAGFIYPELIRKY